MKIKYKILKDGHGRHAVKWRRYLFWHTYYRYDILTREFQERRFDTRSQAQDWIDQEIAFRMLKKQKSIIWRVIGKIQDFKNNRR